MVPSLEAETQEHEAGDDERRGDPDYGQAGFGFENTTVASHVDTACKIMQPMAHYFAQEGRNNRGEIEESSKSR